MDQWLQLDAEGEQGGGFSADRSLIAFGAARLSARTGKGVANGSP